MTSVSSKDANATYARVSVGTQRYSRTELAEMRRGVRLLFGEPPEPALASLVSRFERIQGRLTMPNQLGYLMRCWRIHGPATERLLTQLYRERGTDQNLLLALELAPPAWLDAEEAGDPVGSPDWSPGGAGRDDPRRDDSAQDVVDDDSVSRVQGISRVDPAGERRTTAGRAPDASPATSPRPTGWRCPVGRDHVPRTRPDGSTYCATCHP